MIEDKGGPMSDKKKPIKDETCKFLRTLADKIEGAKIPKSKILCISICRIDESKRGHKDFQAYVVFSQKSVRKPAAGRAMQHADDCSWNWV
jgi:hypothetical protein